MSQSDSAVDCLATYLPYWRARGLSQVDAYIISHFLFSSGAYNELIRFCIESLEKEDPIAWPYLGKVLRLRESSTQSPVYQALKSYIEDHRRWDEFTNSELFDVLFPQEGDIKVQQLQRRIQIKERHRQTLLDQIRVFNQSRNYNIEKQGILKFIKFFPNEKLGQELLERYEFEDLQRFFHRYQNEKQLEQKAKPQTFTEEEKKLLQHFFENTRNQASQALESYLYFFLFLEDYSHALELITQIKPSPAKDWLYLDLLLLNRKFAAALAYIHEELEPLHQSEATFYSAKIYYVAQCLWGLGEPAKAIDLMHNLTNVHPDYRLASSFLKEWKSEL